MLTLAEQHEIAAALRRGDMAGWHRLYDATAASVWRAVARALPPDSPDVADVVQDIYIAASRSAATFDAKRGDLCGWLFGIARRLVALHYRKAGQRQRLIEAAASLAGRQTAAEPQFPAEAEEVSLLVRAALAELPDEYETALTSHYLNGATVESLGEAMNRSPVAVRSLLARARAAFRELFDANWGREVLGFTENRHESIG